MRTFFTIVTLAVLVGMIELVPLTSAWWCTGHMLVAEIARNLTKGTPAGSAVENIIQQFSAVGPFPENPNSVEVACWADDIKDNQGAMSPWHFINIVYNPNNVTIPNGAITPHTPNVVTQIQAFTDSIYAWPNFWESSFSVAWLIHLYGDIHQPLHCTVMYDTEFPYGDLGGNRFKIMVNGKQSELHAYWDSVCGEFSSYLNRPLNATGMDYLRTQAASIVAENPVTPTEARQVDPKWISLESYMDAVDYAYQGLTPNATITQAYHDRCLSVARKRIALAGYRLATVLTRGFDRVGACLSLTSEQTCDEVKGLCYWINGTCQTQCSAFNETGCANVPYCYVEQDGWPAPYWVETTPCRIRNCRLLQTSATCAQARGCRWVSTTGECVENNSPQTPSPTMPTLYFTALIANLANFTVASALDGLSALIPYPRDYLTGTIVASNFTLGVELLPDGNATAVTILIQSISAQQLASIGLQSSFTPQAAPPAPSAGPAEAGSDAGLIAGIVIGCVVAVALVVGVACFIRSRRRSSGDLDGEETVLMKNDPNTRLTGEAL